MLLKEKEEIEAWLNKYQIKNYELIEDQEYGYVVNVNENVDLYNKELKNIEVKFNEVNGYFNCSNNKLKSLEGCPKIVKKTFWCCDNLLEELKGCPKIVKDDFNCSHNQLTSLEGSPKKIEGWFNCDNNKLTSLEGGPEIINRFFDCNNNNLNIAGLKFLPKKIKSNVIGMRNNNQLGDLKNIKDFKELKDNIKDFFSIEKEKEKLLNIIKNENINNKNINKL